MDSTAATNSNKGTPHRFFRFTLRGLLIVMTLVCVLCGLWVRGLVRQRTAVRRFYELTAHRMMTPGDDQLTTMGYRYQGKDQYYKPILSIWQHPLCAAFGEEAFGEVTSVQLIETPANDQDLRYVAYFPTMERVFLSDTQVTDEGLVCLLACPKLRMLTLQNLPITDAGVERLVPLQNLEFVSLSGTQITDRSLEYLARMPRLMEVLLNNTVITNDGYLRLQAALPNCKIQADVPAYHEKARSIEW